MATTSFMGVWKSIAVGRMQFTTVGLWNLIRTTLDGNEMDLSPDSQEIFCENLIILEIEIARVGIIFDINLLPDLIDISTIELKLYCESKHGTTWDGITIYSAPDITCLDDGDYSKVTGRLDMRDSFKELVSKETVSLGYNSFMVNNFPRSTVYGDRYVCYGIGNYAHDFLNSKPSILIGDDGGSTWAFGSINCPQLIVTYEPRTIDPDPVISTKMKVVGII